MGHESLPSRQRNLIITDRKTNDTMKFNFDEIIDRSGTSAVKWDGMKEVWGRTDLIPLWVADMDFATAPFIMDAVRKRCENPVLG